MLRQSFFYHYKIKITIQKSQIMKAPSEISFIIPLYITYIALSVVITVFVATTLFRNGKLFLLDIFHGNKELAQAVNNLLLVGFYLVNVGYVVYTMNVTGEVDSARGLAEILSLKIGRIIIILGAMHFGNMYIFFKLRKRAIADRNDPTLNIEMR